MPQGREVCGRGAGHNCGVHVILPEAEWEACFCAWQFLLSVVFCSFLSSFLNSECGHYIDKCTKSRVCLTVSSDCYCAF